MSLMKTTIAYLTLAAGLLLGASPSWSWDPLLGADSFLLSEDSRPEVIGVHRFHPVKPNETLVELGRTFRIGYTMLRNANPNTDPWLPTEGEVVLLPYSVILPADAGPGITVNLAEMRLYVLWEEEGRRKLKVYPVGVGREGLESPQGEFTILNKVKDPTWVVPKSIRKERPDAGAQVPPGPDNPLGGYWMGFSSNGYGIHGTSEPLGVGRRVSHGCLRLFPEDIEDLFARVPIGTPVRIINQPIKVGLRNKTLFMESHRADWDQGSDRQAEVARQVRNLGWSGHLDWPVITWALEENRGIPVPIALEN